MSGTVDILYSIRSLKLLDVSPSDAFELHQADGNDFGARLTGRGGKALHAAVARP